VPRLLPATGLEAPAVVADPDVEPLGALGERDADPPGSGVLPDVEQRLLDDPVGGRGRLGRELLPQPILQLDLETESCRSWSRCGRSAAASPSRSSIGGWSSNMSCRRLEIAERAVSLISASCCSTSRSATPHAPWRPAAPPHSAGVRCRRRTLRSSR
jgi:hypothetical protein